MALPSSASGIIFHESMALHKCLWDSKYNEKPERFTRILERCQGLGLIQRCISISPREATKEEILKLHSEEMIDKLENTENLTDEAILEDLSSNYDFLFIHPTTYKLALLAAGCTIDLIDNIVDGNVPNGMAIIRPPGHHAMKSEYCGYCYYNNVALAAQHALDSKQVKRILIVDWDVHHGQATQQMFYDDPRVLYFSIHGYQNGKFWPHLRESDYHYTGRGNGQGYNVNVPLNTVGMGNGDYMAIFQQLLLPIAYEFNPELVIVSAGYDAALGCPEGEMRVTPACYSHLTSSLMGLANGRIAVILEGGYCLKSLAEGAALTLRTLLGDPCPFLVDSLAPPCESAKETILSVAYALRNHWHCLQHFETFSAQTERKVEQKGNQFWPRIEFHGNDLKPLKYPTRDICPVQDPATAAELDAQLDVLIEGTSLHVPPVRVVFTVNASTGRSYADYDVFRKCHQPKIHEATNEICNGLNGITRLIDDLIDGTGRSGVVVSEQADSDSLAALKHAVDTRKVERVLFLDARLNPDNVASVSFSADCRVLCSSIYKPETCRQGLEPFCVGTGEGQGYTVNMGLPMANINGADVLSCIFRVLLPIAYQFNPQLVIMTIGAEYSGEASEYVVHVVRLLTSLAGGRLVLMFQESPDQSVGFKLLESCAQLLLGYAAPMLGDLNCPLERASIEAIKNIIRIQQPYWNALQFDVQLPEENVLVPPWTNDEKVLAFNPELEKLL